MAKFLAAILAATMLMSPGNLTGTWSGTIAQKHDDGTYGEDASAWLQLKQDGSTITGSVGPSSASAHPIENVFLTGDALSFSTRLVDPESKENMTWAFDLKVKDKTMEGMVKAERGENHWEMRMKVARSE
jgi:hypothetical protein